MFQGGFVGIECEINLIDDQVKTIQSIFPEDVNDLQVFKLNQPTLISSTCKLELKFKQSSDFYGRVTVYIIDIIGTV